MATPNNVIQSKKMVSIFRSSHATALLLACSMGLAWADGHGAVTVYENNFEPAAGALMPLCHGGRLEAAAGLVAKEHDTDELSVLQLGTLDRLCISRNRADVDAFFDPTDRSGSFAGGLVSGREQDGTNALGLVLDPRGHAFLNVSLDWALVGMRAEPDATWLGESKEAVVSFYRVAGGDAPVLKSGNAGAVAVAVGDSAAQAFLEERFAIQPWSADEADEAEGQKHALNWQHQAVKVDLRETGLEAGDRVVVVFHVAGEPAYAAFDNVQVTASTPPTAMEHARSFIASKPWESPWSLVVAGLALLGLGANRVLRLR